MWHNDNYIFRGETKRNRLPEKPKPNVDKQGEESRRGEDRGRVRADCRLTVFPEMEQSEAANPSPLHQWVARCLLERGESGEEQGET